MAECKDCKQQVGFFYMVGGRCPDCHDEWKQKRSDAGEKVSNAPQRDAEIETILLTTETSSGLEILERIDIITAECAYGMNMFKDLFASARDFFGGRSEAVQKTMRDARKTVLYELRREAASLGANAVVGVDLDYVELSGAGNMVMLVASGTAVKVRLPSQNEGG